MCTEGAIDAAIANELFDLLEFIRTTCTITLSENALHLALHTDNLYLIAWVASKSPSPKNAFMFQRYLASKNINANAFATIFENAFPII